MPNGVGRYRSSLRESFYGLWSGVFDYDWFYDSVMIAIRQGLTRAWREGAAECGIEPSEYSPEEKQALTNAIYLEIGHISPAAVFIETNSKANGGRWAVVNARLDLWAQRYKDVANQAKIMACADKKLEWVLGATEEHCSSCVKLAGKIKRASYWQRAGVSPQSPPNPLLACGGWRCACELRLTDRHMSPGPLPRLP